MKGKDCQGKTADAKKFPVQQENGTFSIGRAIGELREINFKWNKPGSKRTSLYTVIRASKSGIEMPYARGKDYDSPVGTSDETRIRNFTADNRFAYRKKW